MSEISKELVAASSKMVVLSILRKRESYGYDILQQVKLLSDGQWNWSDGLIYPVLHKLENEKYISSRWELLAGKRKRKYYTITEKGLRFLDKSIREWKFVDQTLQKAWGSQLCKAQKIG